MVLHAMVLLLLATLLMPMHLGESGRLQVEMLLEPEETPLATISMLAEDADEQSDAFEEMEVPDLPDLPALEVPQLFAGGSGTGLGARQNRSAGPRGGSGGQSGPRAEFFGTTASGNRFVYLLDVSGSMNEGTNGRAQPGSRFDRACYELLQSIQQLTEDQWFYVILFSDKTVRMFDSRSPLPQMLRATPQNKVRLRRWMASVKVGGGTDPREALRLGLELSPNAVFLLSDGEFRVKENSNRRGVFTDSPEVADVVERSNSNESPIHTFAYEDERGRDNMYYLSQHTRGVYRYVPPLSKASKDIELTRRQAGRADDWLRMAKILESRDRQQAAQERYGRIVKEFPHTDAAASARKRMQGLSSN
jgi:hypothetical protein